MGEKNRKEPFKRHSSPKHAKASGRARVVSRTPRRRGQSEQDLFKRRGAVRAKHLPRQYTQDCRRVWRRCGCAHQIKAEPRIWAQATSALQGRLGGSKRALSHGAANSGSEPTLPDAALCTNVRSFGLGQKRDKIKGSFAKGLWHKIFQRFRCQRRP